MARVTEFVCQQCGNTTPKWMGKCPSCGEWNSLVETVVAKAKSSRKKTSSSVSAVKLTSIKGKELSTRIPTKISEFDRVLGGGIVPGMVTLIAGEPGIGKSTLLLQLAEKIKGEVIYVSGEESASQIASRAARLGIKGDGITILPETDVDAVLDHVSDSSNPSLLIVDSIQTVTTQDLSGTAGSVGQVRETSARLIAFAKKTKTPIFMTGHVTKVGAIAGPRVLEHMVDTVCWFEGERSQFLRLLRAVKNRFGPTDEVGIFTMEDKGLVEVINPSKLFLSDDGSAPGAAKTALLEGTRPVIAEVEALVVPTRLAFPKRVGHGVSPRRLEILIAVLTRRAGLPLSDFDIFVNAVGGIKVSEPASDLAIALAISSSYFDKPLPKGMVAVGEVGLLGGIREVAAQEKRVKEAKRLGFNKPLTKKEVKTLQEAIRKHFRK